MTATVSSRHLSRYILLISLMGYKTDSVISNSRPTNNLNSLSKQKKPSMYVQSLQLHSWSFQNRDREEVVTFATAPTSLIHLTTKLSRQHRVLPPNTRTDSNSHTSHNNNSLSTRRPSFLSRDIFATSTDKQLIHSEASINVTMPKEKTTKRASKAKTTEKKKKGSSFLNLLFTLSRPY